MGILLVYQENEGGGASTPLTPRILFDGFVDPDTDINPNPQASKKHQENPDPCFIHGSFSFLRQGAGCSAPFHRTGRFSILFPLTKVLFTFAAAA